MKEFFKVTTALVLFVLGSLVFLTFVRNVDKQPSVLLTSTDCNPPCWQGIYPGHSTASDVYKVLDNFTGVNKDTILAENNRSEELIRIFWFFQWPAEDQMGSANIENDRVTAINISTINSLKLGDLIQRAGEPELYWTGIGQRDDKGQFLDIVFLAPGQGYAAELVRDIGIGSDHVDVKASTPVFRVTYFSPDMYEKLLETHILIDKPVNRRVPLQEWTGYGPIPVQRVSFGE